MIWHQVPGRLEEVRGDLVQNLALERNRLSKNVVESRNAVCGDQYEVLAGGVRVSYLSLVSLPEFVEARAINGLIELVPDYLAACHERCF
jgi:hypothetical protein